jgi:hypothetical protein
MIKTMDKKTTIMVRTKNQNRGVLPGLLRQYPLSRIQLEPMRLITKKPKITPTTNTTANEV